MTRKIKDGEMNLCTLMFSVKSRSHVDTQPHQKIMKDSECKKSADKFNKKPESQRTTSGQYGKEYMEKKCVKTNKCRDLNKCSIM